MKRLVIFLILLIPVTLFSQSCLPEGITFASQAQINCFQFNYSGCTEIEGDVYIMGHDINNLEGLNVLSAIGGELWIEGTSNLENLVGLENLTSIRGGFRISYVSFQDFNGLEDLNSIGGDFGCYRASITSLVGLEGLDSIHGRLSIVENNLLNDITALDWLSYLGGGLNIEKNQSLSTCQSVWLCDYLLNPNGAVNIKWNALGCNSIIEVGGNCNDSIPCLPYGTYSFSTQADIDNFQNVFPGCTELEGNLNIYGVEMIGKLLSNGDFNISNLEGLNVVTSIGGELFINGNDSLTSLSGLDNIKAESISDLYITWNSSLSMCEVQSICDYLASPNGTTDIRYNDYGCNSQSQVQQGCATASVNEVMKSGRITASPNPFTTSTTISYELNHPSEVTIHIYNQFGKLVEVIEQHQQAGKQQITWNAEGLPAGIYYFRLDAGDQVASGKVVLVR